MFSCIGFVEYATKTIILNSKLVVANDLHTYFTVNSVFFDPDIFGRYPGAGRWSCWRSCCSTTGRSASS